MSDNTEQFLTAVKTVALKAETFSEAYQLIVWFKSNVPYVESGEDNFILLRALDDLCHDWDTYGCAEDEILPALSLAYTFAAHNRMTKAELDLLAERQSRCNWMKSNPDLHEHITSYEEFCDKYANELN